MQPRTLLKLKLKNQKYIRANTNSALMWLYKDLLTSIQRRGKQFPFYSDLPKTSLSPKLWSAVGMEAIRRDHSLNSFTRKGCQRHIKPSSTLKIRKLYSFGKEGNSQRLRRSLDCLATVTEILKILNSGSFWGRRT
jgi:hypothetical protein